MQLPGFDGFWVTPDAIGSKKMVTAFPRLSAAQQALDSNHIQEAARIALQHVREHPQDPRGLGLLGAAAMRMGALGQAEQFLRKAQSLAPRSQQVLMELGSCLQQQERLAEALEIFEQVDASSDHASEVAFNKAVILDKLGRADEARERLAALTANEPANLNAWLAYAHNLRSAGETDEAVRAYRRAIAIDFERGDAWWGLASIRKPIFTDEDVATMQEAIRIAIDPRNLSPLHFALARAHHNRKEYEQAFYHYSEGNRIRAETIGYQVNELTEEVDEYVRKLGPGHLSGPSTRPGTGPVPIFLVSLPRSGSTLLEQMLGSHPDIQPAGELSHIPALIRAAMEHHTRQGRFSLPEVIQRIGPQEAEALGVEYLRRASQHIDGGAKAFVDKLPHNWSNIPFIRKILPQAKFVDIRRPAMDCCFANFTQSFSRAHAASFALEHIGQCYVDYVRLMDHLDRVAPGLVHHVRYERLIEEPEPELRSIFDYLEIEWDDAPLNFHQLDRIVRTPSAEQVRRPLNREGLDVWKPYSQWLGPLREVLGPLADK